MISNLNIFSYSVFLLIILETNQQPAKISQIYPQPTESIFQTFTTTSYNGLYLADQSIYMHSEFGSAGASIKALRKDGTMVKSLAQSSASTYNLARLKDKLLTFGLLSDIRQFDITYIYPDFFVLSLTQSVGHNRNFKLVLSDSSDTKVFVTTTTGGIIYAYSVTDLTQSLLTGNLPPFSTKSMDAAIWIADGFLLIAGTASDASQVDSSTLIQTNQFPTEASVKHILKDNRAFNQDPVIDITCDSINSLQRKVLGVSGFVQINTRPYLNPFTNLLEFRSVNYLAVSAGTSIDLIKRTTYDLVESFGLNGVISIGGVGCCEDILFKYTFSAVLQQTSPPQIIFSSFRANLDFCSGYNNAKCVICNQGYKLTNTSDNNTCISEDEYPPRYGVRGSTIVECFDSRCSVCTKAYYKCEVCDTPYLINAASFNCTTVEESQMFGIDLTNTSVVRRCVDSECRIVVIRSRVWKGLHEV